MNVGLHSLKICCLKILKDIFVSKKYIMLIYIILTNENNYFNFQYKNNVDDH